MTLENSAYIALRQLTNDLSETRLALTLLEPGEQCVVFLAPRDANGELQYNLQGDLIFSTAVRYFADSVNQRVMKEVVTLTTAEASPENPLALGWTNDSFPALPEGQRQIARDCVNFEAQYVEESGHLGATTDGTPGAWVPAATAPSNASDSPARMDLRLQFATTLNNRRRFELVLESSVKCRN